MQDDLSVAVNGNDRNRAAILEFLDALYGKNTLGYSYGPEPLGYVALWTPGDKRTYWVSTLTPSRIPMQAAALAPTDDVYFGVGLRRERLGRFQRGLAEDVSVLPGLWLDLDVAHPVHKRRNLPQDRDAARRLLDEFPLAPSIIIDSGHGFQVYWVFTELWRLDTPDERWAAQLLLRRLQVTFQELARRTGWAVDSTYDLARVLRLPGTVNRKAAPVPVEVVMYDAARRYRPADFEPYVLASDQLTSVVEAPRTVALPKDLPSVDLNSLRLSERMRAVIRTGDDPSDPQRYDTRSEAVGAVVTALVVADYDDATIAGILLDPGCGISAKPREKGVSWVAQELARIRAKVKALRQEPVRDAPAGNHVKPFPLRVLPAPLARFARETAEAMPVAVDFIGVSVLAVAGAALGNSRAIAVKRDWQESARVYCALVGESGDKKSPTLKRVLQPLYRFQTVLHTRHKAAVARHKRELTRHQVRLRRWQAEQKAGKGRKGALPPGEPTPARAPPALYH
jgi:hypothetical protein